MADATRLLDDALERRGAPEPYAGLACNNLTAPIQAFAANSVNTRTPHFARTRISGWGKLRLPWYFIENTGWETGTGLSSATVALQIEYPVGVMTPVYFSASLTGTIAAGGVLWSDDFIWPDIPEGGKFWFHSFASTAGTNIVLFNRSSNTGATTGGATITNGQSNQSANAAFVGANPHIYWGPDLAVCMTNRRTFLIIGDSREQDLSGRFDMSLDAGALGVCLGPDYGMTSISISGGSLNTSHATPSKRTHTYAAAAFVSDAICALGYNDRTIAQATVGTYMTTLYAGLKAANANVKVGQTTIFSGTTAAKANVGLSSSGTTATATMTQRLIDQLWVGETVNVAGVTPAGYNGDVVITAISGATYSYTLLAGATGLAVSTVHGTTSDLWQSPNPTVFQTPASDTVNLGPINTDIRNGRTNQDYYIDLADLIDFGRDKLFSKPGMMRDGVHLSPYGKSQVKASGAVLHAIPGLLAA